MPWQADPLRDFPHMREHFMEIWHQELKAINARYVLISGLGDERYHSAIVAIDNFVNSLH
jgi:nicotinamide riboside kinase